MKMQNVTMVQSVAFVALAVEADRLENYTIVDPYHCIPGENFKVDCNHCKCGKTSEEPVACTIMACGLGPDECIPRSFFEVDGKFCECPPNGHKWDSRCFGRKETGESA